MSEELIYNPAPVQKEFHVCPANEILLGGAAGPGKSLALLMDPVQTQLIYEHQRWARGEIKRSVGWAIHFRREFPRLEQTIERSQRLFRAIDPGAKYDSQAHRWTFSCGYKLSFGHMKDLDDRFNYVSNEYTHIAWDELCEFEQEMYQFVNTRLRTSDHFLQKRLRIVAATNPTGNWVRRYFVDPAREGRRLLVRTISLSDGTSETRSRIFIPATLKDNPDPEFRRRYELELQDKPAHIRRALLFGDWYVIAGAFFADEFVPDIHICEPFKIPTGWTRFRSMDWGYKSPGTVGYYAVDPDNNLWKYREVNFRGMDASQVAIKLRNIEEAAGEWDVRRDCSLLTGPADTQIWEKRGTIGPTVAETMAHEGIFWQQATKNRHASVQQFLLRLKDRGNGGGGGNDGSASAGINFFKTCRKSIETIQAIGTDEKDPELPADGGDDHWLDETLYACMYRAAVPKSDGRRHSRSYYDELEEARQKRRERKRGGGRFGYGSW